MRNRLLAIGLIVALVAGFGIFTAGTGTDAQDSTSPHGIVGAWYVTTYVEGQPPALNLTSFYADGNVVTSNRPVFPPAPGETAAEARSAGQGAWIANEDGSIDMTFVVLRADLTGTFTGQRILRGHFTLDSSGDAWSGPFTATVLDADGAKVAVVPGRAEGKRIVAEPFDLSATPAANS